MLSMYIIRKTWLCLPVWYGSLCETIDNGFNEEM